MYPLNFVQSFAFGSLISAVDPVATLAIFQALDVDPVLNMLVRIDSSPPILLFHPMQKNTCAKAANL